MFVLTDPYCSPKQITLASSSQMLMFRFGIVLLQKLNYISGVLINKCESLLFMCFTRVILPVAYETGMLSAAHLFANEF